MGPQHSSAQRPEGIAVWGRKDPVTGFMFTIENASGRLRKSRLPYAIEELCNHVEAHVQQMQAQGQKRSRFVRTEFKRLSQGAVRYLRKALAGSEPVLFSATLVTAEGETPVPVHELTAASFEDTLAALEARIRLNALSLGIDLTWMQFDLLCQGFAVGDPATVDPVPASEDTIALHAYEDAPSFIALKAAFSVWQQTAPAMARAALTDFTSYHYILPSGESGSEPSKLVNAWLAGKPPAEGTSSELTQFVSRLAVDMVGLVSGGVVVNPGLLQICGGRLLLYSGIPEDALESGDTDTQRPLYTGTKYPGAEVGWFRRRMVSTSLIRRVASGFAAHNSGPARPKQRAERCCLFRLFVVPPMRVLPVWDWSSIQSEVEVVLPPGYRWRVSAAGTLPSEPDLAVRDLECVNPDMYEDPAVRSAIMEGLEQRVGQPFLPREDFDALFGGWQPLYDTDFQLD